MHGAGAEVALDLLALDGRDLEPRALRGRAERRQPLGRRQQAMAAAARVGERCGDRVAAVQPEPLDGPRRRLRARRPALAIGRLRRALAARPLGVAALRPALGGGRCPRRAFGKPRSPFIAISPASWLTKHLQ